MKFFHTIFMLSLIIIFIFVYSNNKVLAKKIEHKNNNKSSGSIVSHKDKNHTKEKHLKTRQNWRQSKLKLSAQLTKAKEICWSGQHISTRIMNGTNATKDTLPWMVAIFYQGLLFHCGASIVSAKFVLSAAHCFKDKSHKPTDYALHYGMQDFASENYVKGTIAKIHNHPKYVLGYNDIALIRLKHEIKYNDVISPICIPGLTTPSFWDKWAMGDPVLISGWGQYKTENTPPSEKYPTMLQKGFGYIVNSSVCDKVKIKFDHSTNICVGNTSKEAKLCYGDSGSPVIPLTFLLGKDSFVFPVVIGVVSFGDEDCRGPDVLTKVESFISWINKVTFKT